MNKKSIVSIAWNSNISSFNLFSTIFKSIKEVVNASDDVKTTTTRKISVKRIEQVDPNKQYTSTRQIPQNILRKKVIEPKPVAVAAVEIEQPCTP